jgi:hypothetical protein
MATPEQVTEISLSQNKLSQLVTTINEVIVNTNQNYTDVGNVISFSTISHISSNNISDAVCEIFNDTGNISQLSGFTSSNVVGALNELKSQINLTDIPVFVKTFTNSDLTASVLTVNHNLGNKYVICQVYNNLDKQILPDDIELISTTQLKVNLVSFGVISGNWKTVIKN